jgi:hypothetical protein
MEISDGAIVKWNYELCVKVVNKFNIRPKTPSIVILSWDNIYIRESSVGQKNYRLLAKRSVFNFKQGQNFLFVIASRRASGLTQLSKSGAIYLGLRNQRAKRTTLLR